MNKEAVIRCLLADITASRSFCDGLYISIPEKERRLGGMSVGENNDTFPKSHVDTIPIEAWRKNNVH